MRPIARSVILHLGSISVGAVAAISAMASSGVDLYAAYEHAYTGVKELMMAWYIVVPILTIGYAAYKNTTKQKLLDAVSAPNALEAAREIKPTAAVIAVADQLKLNGH